MIAVAAVQQLVADSGPFRASVPQQEPAENGRLQHDDRKAERFRGFMDIA
jgi:hypothetical protein